jgi:HAD superfamily hydrolase (TIGR01490 family)
VIRPGVPRTAAFFDLDKTIVAKSSTLAFSRPLYRGGLINRRAVLRSAYGQLVYRLGGADHAQMERVREYLSIMIAGWDVQTVKEIVADTLEHIVQPLVYAEAVELIDQHHREGRDVIIVSSAGADVVEPIGELLGADRVIATQLGAAHGKYTGEITFYAYGEHKADAIRELADEQGYDLANSYAYSDSITDAPMLELAGHPFAVNPDRALRRLATVCQWPILRFPQATALRRRTALGVSWRSIGAAAVAGGAAAAGLVWVASKRRIQR